MPPIRPKTVASIAGVSSGRSNLNTPMSERQQMALLIQMTSTSSECLRSASSKRGENKKEDVGATVLTDKHETPEIYVDKAMTPDFQMDAKLELNNKRAHLSPQHKSGALDAQITKRPFSDIEEEDDINIDEERKKKKKDIDSAKDFKPLFCNKIPMRSDKNLKQFSAINKNSPNNTKQINIGEGEYLCGSPKNIIGKICESVMDSDELKTPETLFSGGLKVPPLKIVIPSQNCSIDTEGNIYRSGKAITSRNAALPYVVTTSTEIVDRDSQCNSPHESPIKLQFIAEDKTKSFSDDKGLHRVLRSSHRTSVNNPERTSNNSSPQLQSISPSPESITTQETSENKASLFVSTSPIVQNIVYDNENITNLPSPSTSSTSSLKEIHSTYVDLHPRRRKIRIKQDDSHVKLISSIHNETPNIEVYSHEFPFTNSFHMYLNIRKQIDKKHKLLFHIKPRPPQGYDDYSLQNQSYILNGCKTEFLCKIPTTVSSKMRDIFIDQEKERYELRLRHTVEREKLVLTVEQEILRVHTKAARSISCQPAPFSVCTLIKDEEVYNILTSELEDKDRNARHRFNGRLLLSWLQDVDDKWEKVKEAMVLRHHNEAESLHAVQAMDWDIALKQRGHCEYSLTQMGQMHVPMVHVSDDFDLLPS